MFGQTKRYVYIGLGTFFLVLGAIGAVVPLLPTVPFWLLTCWFYLRSSRRLYDRFLSNRYVGPSLRDYLENRTIPLRAKIYSLTVMWTSLLLTAFFASFSWGIKIPLLLIGAGVSWHILSRPCRRNASDPEP